jgi:hypothetical protein
VDQVVVEDLEVEVDQVGVVGLVAVVVREVEGVEGQAGGVQEVSRQRPSACEYIPQ